MRDKLIKFEKLSFDCSLSLVSLSLRKLDFDGTCKAHKNAETRVRICLLFFFSIKSTFFIYGCFSKKALKNAVTSESVSARCSSSFSPCWWWWGGWSPLLLLSRHALLRSLLSSRSLLLLSASSRSSFPSPRITAMAVTASLNHWQCSSLFANKKNPTDNSDVIW